MKAKELSLSNFIYAINKNGDCNEYKIYSIDIYNGDRIKIKISAGDLIVKEEFNYTEVNGTTYYFSRKDYLKKLLPILQQKEREINLEHINCEEKIRKVVDELQTILKVCET